MGRWSNLIFWDKKNPVSQDELVKQKKHFKLHHYKYIIAEDHLLLSNWNSDIRYRMDFGMIM